jgi:drug/metabolite transporter superfamily protein YnfA
MKIFKDYRLFGYASIVVLVIGIVFNVNNNHSFFDKIMVAIGGLFLIIAMKKKQDLDQVKQQNQD